MKGHAFLLSQKKSLLLSLPQLHLPIIHPRSNYWSLTWNNPDLVPKVRTQICLLFNVGLRRGVPWLQGTSDITCPLCNVELGIIYTLC